MSLRGNLIIPFRSIPSVYSGMNAIAALRQIPMVRCVVVLSRSVGNSEDLIRDITSKIKCHKLVFLYKEWEGEPDFSHIIRLAAKFEENAPDCIVAMGGGSLIDAAKASRLLYEHPELLSDEDIRPFSIPPCRKSIFITIPTTIGTGSEAASSAVVKGADGRKRFIVSHELISHTAILDPVTVINLPIKIRLTTVADALSHAVESYVSTIEQPQAADLAEQAVRLIRYNWRYALDDTLPNLPAQNLQRASLYGGYAQNHCLVGAAHALAHISSENGNDHGLANAFYLPAVITANSRDQKACKRYAELAERIGLTDVDGLIALAQSLRDAIAIPKKPAIFSEEQLERAVEDPGGRANPIPLTLEILKEIERLAHAG